MSPASHDTAFTGPQVGGISYEQQAAPLKAIYNLGGTLCVPGGSALHAPAPHDTPFMGPCCPDPEDDISAGLHLRHGFWLATLYSILQWRANWLSVIFIPGQLLCSIVLASFGVLSVLGGSASLAIPLSVTCEVQDASSLMVTPLTNAMVLPLLVSSYPSLLGSS